MAKKNKKAKRSAQASSKRASNGGLLERVQEYAPTEVPAALKRPSTYAWPVIGLAVAAGTYAIAKRYFEAQPIVGARPRA